MFHGTPACDPIFERKSLALNTTDGGVKLNNVKITALTDVSENIQDLLTPRQYNEKGCNYPLQFPLYLGGLLYVLDCATFMLISEFL